MNRVYLHGFAQRAEASGTEPGRPIRFIVATEGRKGDGLNLQMSGANLERFKANPVVMPNHDYSRLPIGRAENISIEDGQLLADAVFDTGSPEGAETDRLYREGFLNAVSVGFDITDMDTRTGDVHEWELIEFSAVSVPMDPSAVVESGRTLAMARAFDAVREGAALTDDHKAAVQQAVESLSALLNDAEEETSPEGGEDAPAGDAQEDSRGLALAAARLGVDYMERVSSA
ncbi:HK97 family phage prohead protease [Nesterenkonia sp. HG001]|uniref:HK97 family phage prohead protease n=1 Tax=Nesterenkonia sp. HG001 TaxID=2983207 RepID=UPI002AC58C66|nr:HK97 family phage prohead protease [Nesterenkonia sp. HG001]MDZ5077875.1 HK97 family phage prohead protease [Nesterenkonia sp. HG001]